MPMTACPDCRKTIALDARACPHCGAPLSERRLKKFLLYVVGALVFMVVFWRVVDAVRASLAPSPTYDTVERTVSK